MIRHVRIETTGYRVQKHDSVPNRQEVEQNRAETVERSLNGEFLEDRRPARLVSPKGEPIPVPARFRMCRRNSMSGSLSSRLRRLISSWTEMTAAANPRRRNSRL